MNELPITEVDKRGLEQLDTRDLRLLVELSSSKSISVAAAACGIGQPAATKRLKRIADNLGLQIVERRQRQTFLTADGVALAKHGERVLRSLQRLQAELGPR